MGMQMLGLACAMDLAMSDINFVASGKMFEFIHSTNRFDRDVARVSSHPDRMK